MGKAFRSCLGFFSVLLCSLCFAFVTASVVYADDWQESQRDFGDGQYTMAYNNGNTWVFGTSSISSGSVKSSVLSIPDSTRVDQVLIQVPISSTSFGLDGRLQMGVATLTSGDPVSVSVVATPVGSTVGQTLTSGFSYFFSQGMVTIDFSGLLITGYRSLDFYISFQPFTTGVSDSVFLTGTATVGFGSALSPTFPGSGLTASDLPADVVSAMEDVESRIKDSIGDQVDQANSMITDLPNQLENWRSSLSFVRNLSNEFTDRADWLSLLLSISLALGVIALLLNLSAWAGRKLK